MCDWFISGSNHFGDLELKIGVSGLEAEIQFCYNTKDHFIVFKYYSLFCIGFGVTYFPNELVLLVEKLKTTNEETVNIENEDSFYSQVCVLGHHKINILLVVIPLLWLVTITQNKIEQRSFAIFLVLKSR